MQNKANFQKTEIDATTFPQTTYEKFCPFWHPKNKAKTNPNKANFKNVKK